MKEQSSNATENLLRVVKDLEKERKSRIWCIVHCGADRISEATAHSIYRQRKAIDKGTKIEVLLHSPGGNPGIAYSAMKFFRSRFTEVNIIVPLLAKSAATLMCLGADRIYMGELSELGPLDIQIDDQVRHGAKNFSPLDEFKSMEFMREQAIHWMEYYALGMNRRYGFSIKDALTDSVPLVTGLMRPLFERIDPTEIGGHRRALAVGEEYARRLLGFTQNPNASKIVEKIVWKYPSHDFLIDYDEAKSLELPVELLPDAQESMLADVLLGLKKDNSFQGFVPVEE